MTPQEKLQTIAAMLDHVDQGCESLGARCDDFRRADGRVGDVVRSGVKKAKAFGNKLDNRVFGNNQGARELAYAGTGAVAGGLAGSTVGFPITGAVGGFGAGTLLAKKGLAERLRKQKSELTPQERKRFKMDAARADFGESRQAKLFPSSGSTRKPMGKLRSALSSEGFAHRRAGKTVAKAGGSSKALLPEGPSFRKAPPTMGQNVGRAAGKVGHALGAPGRGLAKAGSAVKKWHGEHYYDSMADSDVAAFVRNVNAFTAHLEAMGA